MGHGDLGGPRLIAVILVAELEQGGYITRHRDGHRNRYALHDGQPLRHPPESSHRVDELLGLLSPAG